MASWSDGGQIFRHISVAKACGSPWLQVTDQTPRAFSTKANSAKAFLGFEGKLSAVRLVTLDNFETRG